MPGIDEAAMDEKARLRPALDERLHLAFYILLMLDGQQFKGLAADQVGAQLRDEQHLRLVVVICIGWIRHAGLLSPFWLGCGEASAEADASWGILLTLMI
jgi:hypothetical protein